VLRRILVFIFAFITWYLITWPYDFYSVVFDLQITIAGAVVSLMAALLLGEVFTSSQHKHNIFYRLQAGTKCVTLGTIFILLGVMIFFGFTGTSSKALLCLLFILITSPTAAHAISKGAHRAGVALWKKSVVDKYKEDKEGTKG